MKIEAVADFACVCGENPLWHPTEKRLYWTDIPGGKLFRYDPATGGREQCYSGRPVGGFTLQPDGSLLLFMDRGTVATYRDGALTTVVEEIPDERETRFNDVIADPEGRVFCGTMPTKQRLGRLYRLDPDGSVHKLVEEVGTANGMGFTGDLTGFYFTDSRERTISRFDYDRATGEITNRRTFVQMPEDDGVPDGMTVDADGNVWTAKWGGYGVVQYSPEGQLLRDVECPNTRNVSSVTFGGDDLSTMYLTTAGGDDRETNGPDAGALLRLEDVGAQGVAEFNSRVQTP